MDMFSIFWLTAKPKIFLFISIHTHNKSPLEMLLIKIHYTNIRSQSLLIMREPFP